MAIQEVRRALHSAQTEMKHGSSVRQLNVERMVVVAGWSQNAHMAAASLVGFWLVVIRQCNVDSGRLPGLRFNAVLR